MATFPAPTDRGSDTSALHVELDAAGDPRAVGVDIALSDGRTILVPLTSAEAAALTAGERTALRTALTKLYAAAVTKAGGV